MTTNEQLQFHSQMMKSNDLAYIYAVDNDDLRNMQMVLRAHGKEFDCITASDQLAVGQHLKL